MAALFPILFLGFVIWIWRRQGWIWFTVLGFPAFPVLVWEWWRTPTSFVVANGNLTARWFWGHERTWQIDNLTIPGASSVWTLVRTGYARVLERSGKSAFNVAFHLEGFGAFLEVIEPGTKERRAAKYNPNSWWNRNLLK